MAAPLTAFHRVTTCAVGLVAVAFSSWAVAAPATLLREAFPAAQLRDRPGLPLTGRYQMDDGESFVLDRSTSKPLMKFDDDLEIWALQPAPGPRGDTIYRNDLGEPMLRATRIGGMTVFTQKRPEGSAAALDGGAPPLRLSPMSPQALFRIFYQASLRASRAAGRQIEFVTLQDADPASSSYLADAAQVASEALADVAALPGGKAALSHIGRVAFAQGGKGGVAAQKGVITITIAISEGIFGRPSSHRIERVALGR
jgi:hypothetical protein